jgi:hypothetical protein
VPRTPQNVRSRTGLIAVVAFVLLAGAGSVRGLDRTWTGVAKQRAADRRLTPLDRQNASAVGVADPRVLGFWAERVHRGDRYYLNVLPSTPGYPEWPQVVGEIAGYFLTPATQVTDPGRATVVLSWDEDPADVGLPFSSSATLPGTEVSVSRVGR